MGSEAHVDVALWATVPPRGPIDAVAALVDAGAAAFKLSTFETHPQRFPRIPDDQMVAAFAAIAANGGLAGVHAENDEIVRAGIAAEQRRPAEPIRSRTLARARRSPSTRRSRGCSSSRARPACASTSAMSRRRAGWSLSPRRERDGLDVSAETCPHYLLLDESELLRRGGEAKINPPLRR